MESRSASQTTTYSLHSALHLTLVNSRAIYCIWNRVSFGRNPPFLVQDQGYIVQTWTWWCVIHILLSNNGIQRNEFPFTETHRSRSTCSTGTSCEDACLCVLSHQRFNRPPSLTHNLCPNEQCRVLLNQSICMKYVCYVRSSETLPSPSLDPIIRIITITTLYGFS